MDTADAAPAGLDVASLRQLVLFEIGGRPLRLADLIDSGLEAGPSLASLPREIGEALAEYRYARDLVSAEECEQWLARHGLVYADLIAHVERRLGLRSADDVRDGVVDVLLGDDYIERLRRFAHDVAFAHAQQVLPPAGHCIDRAQRIQWRAQAERWCRERASAAQRAGASARAQRAYTEVHYLEAEFDSLDAAREAWCCVRGDGMALTAVAHEGGFPWRRVETRWNRLPPILAEALSHLALGEVSAVLSEGARHRLIQLEHRRLAALDDPLVLAAVELSLREQWLDPLACQHIAHYPSLLQR